MWGCGGVGRAAGLRVQGVGYAGIRRRAQGARRWLLPRLDLYSGPLHSVSQSGLCFAGFPQALLRDLDTDGDGRLSYAEFLSMLAAADEEEREGQEGEEEEDEAPRRPRKVDRQVGLRAGAVQSANRPMRAWVVHGSFMLSAAGCGGGGVFGRAGAVDGRFADRSTLNYFPILPDLGPGPDFFANAAPGRWAPGPY